MSQDLKQATVAVVPLGPFITSDGTAITDLSLTSGDVRIGIGGLSAVSKTDALALTHSQFGWYLCQLDGTDTGTLGRLDIHVSPAKGGLPVWRPFKVVSSDDFDTKYVANFGPAQASVIAGVAQASTLATVNGQFPLSHITAVGIASVVHALTTVGVVQSLSTVGVVQSLSYVTAVGIASVTHSLSSIANVAMASQISDIGSVLDIVTGVWDRALTGATHNVATTAGKRLRSIDAAFEVTSGMAQSGTADTITLATAESSIDNIFNGDRIIIVAGTGVQEHSIITGYNGSSKVATMSKNWVVTPDNTSEYEVVPADVDIESWNNAAVTSDGDWNELQTDVDAINAQHPLSAVIGVAQASVVDGIAQASVVAGVAQASVVVGVAQASVVEGVAQASSLAAIGPAKNVEMANFPFFMVKSSDHITPLTSVSPVGYIKKDAGAFASLTNAVAEVSSYGMYVVTVIQTEMNADKITFVFTAAGADQVGIVMITT